MIGDKKTNIKIGGDFEPIPADKYTVQITDIDLVTQFNNFKGVEEEVFKFQFTVLDDKPMDKGDESTRGRLLWRRTSQSLSPKSWLLRLLVAVYGRDLTKDEMESLRDDPRALDKIIGKQVDVMVDQTPGKNDPSTIWNNILSFAKNKKPLEGFAKGAPEGYNPRTNVIEKETKSVKPDLDDVIETEDPFLTPKAKPGSKEALEEILADDTEETDEEFDARIKREKEERKAKKAQ